MDNNNPKKSKAFIIAFILILLLLLGGYYLFANRATIFDTKGVVTMQKIFAPLLGSSKNKDLNVIDTTNTSSTTSKIITGVITTDINGNKIILAEAGEDIKKGDVLYISSFNKNNAPIVMKAISSDKSKSLVFGVAGEDINKGAMGNIIIEGILSGVPTNRTEITAWIPNNPLYLSDKIYGGMTKNPPYAPSFVIPVGSVISIDAINGSIRVGGILNDTNITPDSRTNLNKLNSDFLGSSPSNIQGYYGSVFGITNNNNTNGGSSGNTNNNNGIILNPITVPGSSGFSANLPTVTVMASPAFIVTGKSSIISWISTKTTVCNAGTGNGTGTTGSFKTGALSKSMSYTVTCTGANGSKSSGNTSVTIIDPVVNNNGANNGGSGTKSNFPLVKVTAKPTSIKIGESSTISWTATKSVSCNTSTGKGVGTSGSFKTGVLKESTSYSVICISSDGSLGSGNAYVNVNNSPGGNNYPTIKVKATPISINAGGTSTISWTSTNTTSCDAGAGASTNPNGSFITEALSNSRSYSITCKGNNGEVSSDAYVNILDAYKFPTVTVTATPTSVDSGGNSTIKWISENTTGCNAGTGRGTGTTGSFNTGALTKATSYTVVCVGPNGQKGGNVSVSVNGGDSPTSDQPTTGKPQCSDGIDNDSNKLIDIKDPNCHAGGDINATYNPTHDSESSPAPTQDIIKTTTENSCALIEKNPLVFTADEQARLSVLLRKFYLVSSTLRTAEDLTTLNNEIEQNRNFITQIEELTKQCYKEVDDSGIMNLHNGTTIDPNSNSSTNYPKWVRHGNPWYKDAVNVKGGTFPYTNEGTGYSTSDQANTERILNIW